MEFYMSRGRIFALSVVAAIVLSSAALAQDGGGGGGAGGGSSGAGGASGAGGTTGTTGTTSGSRSGPSGNSVVRPLMAKADRVEILLLNLPVARARIASIPQGRELDREALVRALKL